MRQLEWLLKTMRGRASVAVIGSTFWWFVAHLADRAMDNLWDASIRLFLHLQN